MGLPALDVPHKQDLVTSRLPFWLEGDLEGSPAWSRGSALRSL